MLNPAPRRAPEGFHGRAAILSSAGVGAGFGAIIGALTKTDGRPILIYSR